MNREERIDEIVGAFLQKLERGEPADPEDVLRAHPELAETLRERLAVISLLDATFGPHAAAVGPAAPLVGRRLGPYRLTALLGAGGMGAVYLATPESRDRPGERPAQVAVKVVHPRFLVRPGSAERFLREAEIGRRVRHPNVVRTLDAGEAVCDGSNLRYLVMEHVEGRTLRDLLDDLGRVSEQLCRHVGREVARGLAALHAAGAVHRDLKPENVLITADHAVKVMDLGVARFRDDARRLSQSGTFVGSLLYGSPEQFGLPRPAGGAARPTVDHRSDLHALGVLLFELATGAHPFAGEDFRDVVRQVLEARPRRCGDLVPQISPFLEELVAQLLEKDPDLRPATAADVAGILEDGEASAWWRERAALIRRETRKPLRRIRIPRETKLHGREAELATLRDLHARARSGEGAVVLLEGEAGIGKSRLLDEFALSLWAGGEDFDYLVGTHGPAGAASAGGAFAAAYREHLGDDEAAIREVLPHTPLLAPAFAALLRGDAVPEGAERLTADSLPTVFVHATRALAARRTTVVAIEDLHLAPDEGRALFASIAQAAPGHRVLLVGTARPGTDPRWLAQLARIGAVRLVLPRLGSEVVTELLRDALRSPHLAEELAAKVATKSDGNPFFVFEILRGLREGRLLAPAPDGTWVTTRAIREIDVPPSVRDLIDGRLAELEPEERHALDVGACVGFEFDGTLVAEVLGEPQISLLQRLANVERRHRLVFAVGRRFAFDHHQVQERLDAALSGPLREAYHARIAEILERRHGAADADPASLEGPLCEDLASHALAGAAGPRAARYLPAALGFLERSHQPEAAAALALRALASPGVLAGVERAEVLLRRAVQLGVLGRAAEREASLLEAFALADADGSPSLRIRVRDAWGAHLAHVSRFAEAETSLREALAITDASGSSDAGLRITLAELLADQGRTDEARRELELAIERAQADGDEGVAVRATAGLSLVLLLAGRRDEARTLLESALAMNRRRGDRRGVAVSTGNLGIVSMEEGRFEEAMERFAEAVRGTREIGFRQGEAIFTGNLGNALDALARIAEARERLERALALSRDIGNRSVEAYWLNSLGSLAEDDRTDAEAETLLRAAVDLRVEIGHPSGETESRTRLGCLLARTGRADEAVEQLRAACAAARAAGSPGLELVALARLACLPGGDAAAAEDALVRLGDRLDVADAIGARFDLFRATGKRSYLALAKAGVDAILARNPRHRESMLARADLYRDVAAAAAEHGV